MKNFKKVEVYKVDWFRELKPLIEETYGIEGYISAQSNDSHLYGNTSSPHVGTWQPKEGIYCYNVSDVLSDLAHKERIPHGEYLISYSW